MTRLYSGNEVTLLQSGPEYFPALLADIACARQEVHLESYLFAADETGQAVVEALLQAAARGVRVKLLLDGYGARDFPEALRRRLHLGGVALMFYRPEAATFQFRRYRLRRMHRKLAVIDATIAYVGGINLIDDQNGNPDSNERFDFAVRIRGPLLGEIYPAARRLWGLVRWSRIGRRPRHSHPLAVQATPCGTLAARFLQRDNLRHRRAIEEAYLNAIALAREEILIANAYFLPGRHFRQGLIEARARGVRVLLMLQGRTDHPLYQLTARALYRYFLEHGIEIYEYQASELHAKAAVIDAHWATVGSSNIDPFSLFLSREANVVIEDPTFAATLRQRLQQALDGGAHPIHRQAWRHIAWYKRLTSWLLYGFVRLGMGVLGIGSRE